MALTTAPAMGSVADEFKSRRQSAQVARDGVLVLFRPGTARGGDGVEKVRHGVVRYPQQTVSVFDRDQVLRLPERYGVAFAASQTVIARRCALDGFYPEIIGF